MGGEPTSVAHLGGLLLAAVNTSASFTEPSGKLVVIDARTRAIRRSLDLGGQPDSVAVAPSGRYIAVAIENERDEDVADGAIPQAPYGYLAVVDTRTWTVGRVDLTGLAEVAPGDPEPEYVSVNSRDEAIVSLQENNHLAIVSLAKRTVIRHFGAGTVTVPGVDTEDDDRISLTGTITAKREPDGVAWLTDDLFATANEGDYEGGSRGWTIFDRRGRVVWDAGNSLEHLAVAHGLYPDKRSDAKGIEPENVAFGRFDGVPYVFVNAERGNFTAVYDVSRPWAPKFRQLLPTTNGPEGVVAVPSRNLIVVSSEEENPDAGIRGTVQIYGLGRSAGVFPSLVSRDDIAWGTLSGLSAVPGRPDRLVAVTDSAYSPTRLLTIDTAARPAAITAELTLTRNGTPVGYDAEGVAALASGGYWLAVEGSAGKPNLLVRTDGRGAVQQEIPLLSRRGVRGDHQRPRGRRGLGVRRVGRGPAPAQGRAERAHRALPRRNLELAGVPAGRRGDRLDRAVRTGRGRPGHVRRHRAGQSARTRRGGQEDLPLRRAEDLDRRTRGEQAAGQRPPAGLAGGPGLGAGQGRGPRRRGRRSGVHGDRQRRRRRRHGGDGLPPPRPPVLNRFHHGRRLSHRDDEIDGGHDEQDDGQASREDGVQDQDDPSGLVGVPAVRQDERQDPQHHRHQGAERGGDERTHGETHVCRHGTEGSRPDPRSPESASPGASAPGCSDRGAASYRWVAIHSSTSSTAQTLPCARVATGLGKSGRPAMW
nr:hypothetical protein GCM10020092_089940 [Actinoplanes digitatis]